MSMRHCVFDIETLSTESTARVLSLGMIVVDFEKEFEYQDLLNDSFFVKMRVADQEGRLVEQDTLDWWNKQSPEAKNSQFLPKPDDVATIRALVEANAFLDRMNFDRKKSIAWSRGPLDVMVLTSICKQYKVQELFPWWRHREIRTFIDTVSGSDNGYCATTKQIPPELFIAHEPVHDAARDAMMMKYYIEG